MYKTLLVNKSIEDGSKLIERLEQSGFPIRAAFWQRLEDDTSWRLVIVSPLVDSEGPLKTYGRLSEVLRELRDSVQFGISDISVISPTWSQFRELQREAESAGVGRAAGPNRNSRGVVFDDYYIYRWNTVPAA